MSHKIPSDCGDLQDMAHRRSTLELTGLETAAKEDPENYTQVYLTCWMAALRYKDHAQLQRVAKIVDRALGFMKDKHVEAKDLRDVFTGNNPQTLTLDAIEAGLGQVRLRAMDREIDELLALEPVRFAPLDSEPVAETKRMSRWGALGLALFIVGALVGVGLLVRYFGGMGHHTAGVGQPSRPGTTPVHSGPPVHNKPPVHPKPPARPPVKHPAGGGSGFGLHHGAWGWGHRLS